MHSSFTSAYGKVGGSWHCLSEEYLWWFCRARELWFINAVTLCWPLCCLCVAVCLERGPHRRVTAWGAV